MDESSYGWNDLSASWSKSDLCDKVNAITSRDGQSLIFHVWGEERPMSGIKLELRRDKPGRRNIFPQRGRSSCMLKTRSQDLSRRDRGRVEAPVPGLTKAQEKRLALLYFTASYQAGKWLMPAYHFNIDEGIDGVHDDPQHMDLKSWAGQVQALHALIKK
ncbi:hypothetical protein [Rhizobium sp. G21]|uniref:hypothetical protein n=1 Tax=Rhizobium sp. G21 TaxID=2758439 RepID=UPI0016016885|nr:hypothetical protein [Rhizobium sp. G21]MBB1248306.1 hypothetical protein [Rhizobium sp. G21]